MGFCHVYLILIFIMLRKIGSSLDIAPPSPCPFRAISWFTLNQKLKHIYNNKASNPKVCLYGNLLKIYYEALIKNIQTIQDKSHLLPLGLYILKFQLCKNRYHIQVSILNRGFINGQLDGGPSKCDDVSFEGMRFYEGTEWSQRGLHNGVGKSVRWLPRNTSNYYLGRSRGQIGWCPPTWIHVRLVEVNDLVPQIQGVSYAKRLPHVFHMIAGWDVNSKSEGWPFKINAHSFNCSLVFQFLLQWEFAPMRFWAFELWYN